MCEVFVSTEEPEHKSQAVLNNAFPRVWIVRTFGPFSSKCSLLKSKIVDPALILDSLPFQICSLNQDDGDMLPGSRQRMRVVRELRR
jgi:hypothetical protein